MRLHRGRLLPVVSGCQFGISALLRLPVAMAIWLVRQGDRLRDTTRLFANGFPSSAGAAEWTLGGKTVEKI